MTKFQRFQLCSSILPLHSIIFVSIVTYIKLRTNKAKNTYWIKYVFTTLLSFLAIIIYNSVVMTGENLFLNYIGSVCLVFPFNYYLINLQGKCHTLNEVTVVSSSESNLNETVATDSKKKKRKSIIIISIVGTAVFCCSLLVLVAVCFNAINKRVIEDTNGPDDYSLNTLTVNDVKISEKDSFSSFMSSSSYSGDKTKIKNKNLIAADYDKAIESAQSFSGILTINATLTDQDTVTFSVNSSVESGNFAIFIFIDGNYHSEIEINSKQTITLQNISGKTVCIKIAGEDANMRIELTRSVG